MLPEVPTEPTDICPQIIVTEEEICYLTCLLYTSVTRLVIKVCDFVKDRHMRYMQGQPERERYREERARERQLIREQRREERVRRLEEEIVDDEFSDDDFLMDPSEAKKMKKCSFRCV